MTKITERLKLTLKSLLSLKMGEVKTDGAVLVFDGEELVAGMEVYVLDEEGNAVPAADGDYTTEDGKVIKVVEGKVAEIVDDEAEVAEEVAAEEVTEIQEETNEEVAPAEEEVVEEEPATEEDRIAQLEARLAEFTEGLNTIINSIAALEDRLAEVEGKLVKVEAPAAEPIDEQPEVQETSNKTRLSYLRKD